MPARTYAIDGIAVLGIIRMLALISLQYVSQRELITRRSTTQLGLFDNIPCNVSVRHSLRSLV
jgi:hypothetical protein